MKRTQTPPRLSLSQAEQVTIKRRDYYPGMPWTPYAPGVEVQGGGWTENYRGTAEALSLAGLANQAQFPGQPGMRKSSVTVYADGTLPTNRLGSCQELASALGAKRVERWGKCKFIVRIYVAESDREPRIAETIRHHAQWWEQKHGYPLHEAPLPGSHRVAPVPQQRSTSGNVINFAAYKLQRQATPVQRW